MEQCTDMRAEAQRARLARVSTTGIQVVTNCGIDLHVYSAQGSSPTHGSCTVCGSCCADRQCALGRVVPYWGCGGLATHGAFSCIHSLQHFRPLRSFWKEQDRYRVHAGDVMVQEAGGSRAQGGVACVLGAGAPVGEAHAF